MQHFHLKGINFVYKKKNYKIINNKIFSKDRIFIFFSGNGLYYPNTNEVFKKIIINQDRYEWFGISKNIDCKKIIFIVKVDGQFSLKQNAKDFKVAKFSLILKS